MAESNFLYKGQPLALTMTFGVTSCQHCADVTDCIDKADQAIASGEARNRLDRLVVLTQSF